MTTNTKIMTTPFIIWLNKLEVDELITTLLNSKDGRFQDSTLKKQDNLLNFAQDLLKQNRDLINLIEKIEPLNPLQKKAASVYGVNQKCAHYREELEKMSVHCSVYNTQLGNKFQEFSKHLCKDCSRKGQVKQHFN